MKVELKLCSNVVNFHKIIEVEIDEDEIYSKWEMLFMQEQIDDLRVENKMLRDLHKLALKPVAKIERSKSQN